MDFRGGNAENRAYIGIALFVVIVIVIAVFFSNIHVTQAYIEDQFLENMWIEDINERYTESRLLGLEQILSYTYRLDANIDDRYPAYITVTTIKTLFMMNEEELLDKTIETINEAMQEKNIILENNSTSNVRLLHDDEHKTRYIFYNGTDNSTDIPEKVMIIGETWNCGISGTSIICIGAAQITDNKHNNPDENYTYWSKIVRDIEGTFRQYYRWSNDEMMFQGNDGLIFNVKCH